MATKIYDASDGFGVALTKSEIDDFLQNSKLNVRLGTVDKNDEPMIHPVWYYYMNDKIYIESSKDSQKIKNIRRKNIVYFTVDEDRMPYKGVRGKGIAKIIEGVEKVSPITEKLMIKYTGSLDSPIAKELMDAAKSGFSVAIEITPKYYSTWDYSRRG